MPRKPTKMQRTTNVTGLPSDYPSLLESIKQRIRAAQVRAALSANAELIHLYWDIGRAIAARQRQEGWGAGVIPRLARDLLNEIPDVKGFSERNLKPIFDSMKLQFLVCAGVARLTEAFGTTSDSMEPWVCGVHDGSSGMARTTGPRATPAA